MKYPSEQLSEGSFIKVPIIIGTTTDEGTTQSPKPVSTTQQLVEWVTSMLPLHTTYGEWKGSNDQCKYIRVWTVSGVLGKFVLEIAQDIFLPTKPPTKDIPSEIQPEPSNQIIFFNM